MLPCHLTAHSVSTSTRSANLCSWILRTFKSRSTDLMLTTWKSLVLPILDYCSQLWCPSKKGDIQLLEEVQKSFTRKMRIGDRKNYWNRLSSLHLYSLERRRERYRIIYMCGRFLRGLYQTSLKIESEAQLHHEMAGFVLFHE